MEKTRIFISYRREDTAPYAGRIYDRLVQEFGLEQVFIDIDTIPPGDDFVEVLTEKVESCDVLLAVIGKSWLTIADAAGKPRIQKRDDFVAIEIGAALRRKVRVIPVLVGGGRMPGTAELPKALAMLTRRQAHELPDKGFTPALEKLFPVMRNSRSEMAGALMTNAATTETESVAVKWFRKPIVIVLAILSTIAGAFRIAGVGSLFIANALLIVGVGLLIPIEVVSSKWIRKTGRYWPSILLIGVFTSGMATLFLAQIIARQRQQTTATLLVPSAATRQPSIPKPAANPPPTSGSALKLLRYESFPYRVGEPLKVRMFLNNIGSSSLTLFGGTHSVFVDKVPDDYVERGRLEKRLWIGTAKYISPTDRPLKFQPLITFADLSSEDLLSQDRIDQLAKGSVMYMMTIFRDRRGKVILTSCFHTDPSGGNLFFCEDHNTP